MEKAHLSLVFVILVFGGGVAASSHAVLLYYRFPIRYLKSHSAFLILLNAAVFLGLLFNYGQLNLLARLPSKTTDIFNYSYYLVLSVLTVFILYVFAEMVFFILRETWLRKRRALFWIYFSGLILGQVVYMLVNPAVEGIPLYIIFFLGTAVSFFLGNYVLIILLYSRSKGLKTGERKSWVRRLTLFLLLVVTTSIFLDALHLLKALALWSYLLLKSVVIYAVDLLSLVRLKDFIKKIFPEETSPTGMKASIERLFEKHKLTDRERQVTRLICAGKSGREIGNDLFLSPHTIKEYIYRIYKKTGVKNRVQLINLFRDQ